jgi:hypothetical protein
MNEHIAPESASPSTTPSVEPSAEAAPMTTPQPRHTRPPRGVRRMTGHRGGPDAKDVTDAPDDAFSTTHKRKRVARMSDSGLIPALRFNRYVGRQHAVRRPAIVYDTEHTPGYLRLTRLAMGVALLAVAWAASLLVVALTESLVDVFPHQPSLTARFGLYILGAIGLAWLAMVALALIIVGAFSLTLALTRRQW